MRFQLVPVPKSLTLDDLELYKFKSSWNGILRYLA